MNELMDPIGGDQEEEKPPKIDVDGEASGGGDDKNEFDHVDDDEEVGLEEEEEEELEEEDLFSVDSNKLPDLEKKGKKVARSQTENRGQTPKKVPIYARVRKSIS